MWFNVGYNLKSEFSKALSNLFPYEFTFAGEHLCVLKRFFKELKLKIKIFKNMLLNIVASMQIV